MHPVGVLEVGGTHVSAVLVDADTWTPLADAIRRDVDSGAGATQILTAWAEAGAALDAPAGVTWAIAMPDPFDYPDGIGRFRGVGKYEALDGTDVRAELTTRLPGEPAGLVFCNDADAFVLGEWVTGAARGTDRCAGITLGTGVGSGWCAAGRIVDPGAPPGGRIHQVRVGAGGLEDTVSRRAIRRAYAAASGDGVADVRDIADRARAGDATAIGVLAHAFWTLGAVVGPLVCAFGANVLVVGGSMAGSWSLLGAWFAEAYAGPPVRLAATPDTSALVGAAFHAWTVSGRRA